MKLKKLLLIFGLLNLHFLLFAQPTAGLTGHFRFDGNLTNSGPVAMSASSANTSFSTNATGALNKALMFAGSTASYASIVDNGGLDFTGDFSISLGVYMSSTATNQGFYDNGLNYGGCGIWYFIPDNTLRFNFKNGSIGAVGALPANQWKAVCVVRSGSTLRIYVNGVQAATGTEGTSAITYPNAPVLGQMYFAGGGGNYNPAANGSKIDELRCYNRALSATEIAALVGYTLPLKLGDFTATKKAAGIELNWKTITEENTAYFDVERSTNGVDFAPIGKLNARGNSTSRQYYAYTDASPANGINYYRLKMVDIDNTFTHSRTIAVKNNSQLISLALFPNPASSVLQVRVPSDKKETATVFITDAAGKTVYSKPLQLAEGINAFSLPVLQLPAGNYYFTLERKEGRLAGSFVKQ